MKMTQVATMPAIIPNTLLIATEYPIEHIAKTAANAYMAITIFARFIAEPPILKIYNAIIFF